MDGTGQRIASRIESPGWAANAFGDLSAAVPLAHYHLGELFLPPAELEAE